MANITWEIDPYTKDLVFDNDGLLKTIESNETCIQNIRLALEAWKGDFDLVPDHGTDYEKILGGQEDEDITDEIIREAIFQEDGMGVLEKLSVTKGEDRTLIISFSGQLSDGAVVDMEVTAG